jgi:hypothetical protein
VRSINFGLGRLGDSGTAIFFGQPMVMAQKKWCCDLRVNECTAYAHISM